MHVRGYTGLKPIGFTERTAVSFNFSVFPPGGARAPRDPDSPPVELKMHKPGPGAITLGVLIAIGAIIYGASIVWTEILWFRQMSATTSGGTTMRSTVIAAPGTVSGHAR